MENDSEIVAENKLAVIVKESGLDSIDSAYVLKAFSDLQQTAVEWDRRAKEIVVTDGSQKSLIGMARLGRLELKQKRLSIESTRKDLKEASLRKGRAIDEIAKYLKGLIEPIENYLEQQEKFVEIQAAEAARLAKIEADKKAEEERIAREQAEATKRERIRLENEQLKREAEERERLAAMERAEAEAKLQAERQAAAKLHAEVEARARAEKARQDKLLADARAKADAERKAAEERARVAAQKAAQERAEMEAKAKAEREKLQAELRAKADAERKAAEERRLLEEQLKNLIECPNCGHKFDRSM